MFAICWLVLQLFVMDTNDWKQEVSFSRFSTFLSIIKHDVLMVNANLF